MAECPSDLSVILLLEQFPGYTRKTLLEEPAAFVERMRRWVLLKARHQSSTGG